jgi:hypothetical protein
MKSYLLAVASVFLLASVIFIQVSEEHRLKVSRSDVVPCCAPSGFAGWASLFN